MYPPYLFKQTLAALVIVATGASPQAAVADGGKDVLLADCTSPRVMMNIDFAALERSIKLLKTIGKNANWMRNIARKYHDVAKPQRPIKEYLTIDEAGEFEQRSAQNLTLSYAELAESRLRRDMAQLSKMRELAELGWTKGKRVLSEKNPDFRQYVYMFGVQQIFANVDHPDSNNTQECSLDLAFERESEVAHEQLKSKVQSSPEFSELLALRKKYNLSEGSDFDLAKGEISSQDRARAPIVKAAVNQLFGEQKEYQARITALRYFAEVMLMMYEWQREAILELGAAKGTAAYAEADAERYAKLSPQLQKVVNLWRTLDKEFPSQATKNAQSIVDAINLIEKSPK